MKCSEKRLNGIISDAQLKLGKAEKEIIKKQKPKEMNNNNKIAR